MQVSVEAYNQFVSSWKDVHSWDLDSKVVGIDRVREVSHRYLLSFII